MTACTKSVEVVEGFSRRLQVAFDAPQTSSDGGVLLLREVDRCLGVSATLGGFVPDNRDPSRVAHSRQEQVLQRLLQIAQGYEDCNDADTLRTDPGFVLAVRGDLDDGALSSQPTLSRFENTATGRTIAHALQWFERSWVASLASETDEVVLEIDSTADATHGHQQLSMFHGYYDQHMYHPLLVFDGLTGQLVTGLLRPGNVHASKGAAGVLRRLVIGIKRRFPQARVIVRGDSAFAMPHLMQLLDTLNAEHGDIEFVFGLARNARLQREAAKLMQEAAEEHAATGQTVKKYAKFDYAADSWLAERCVVVKAEHSAKGDNPRFVVTTLREGAPDALYRYYCERGQMENDIKNLKNALFADRLSCSRFIANFFRFLLHMAAYRLMFELQRRVRTLAGKVAGAGDLMRVQFDTLRLRLLKVAALVTQSVRRVLVRLPQSFPAAAVFAALLAGLGPQSG